jgi:acetyltransferase
MSACAQGQPWPVSAHTRDGASYRIRPIRPEDAARELAFLKGLSAQSRYNRLFCAISEPSPTLISTLVHVDYERSMAFVAVTGTGESEEIVGVARYAADPGSRDCEFAVTVADAWQSRGIGTTLARLLFSYAREHGMQRIYGRVLANNARMLDLARWIGLTVEPHVDEDNTVLAWMDLQAQPPTPGETHGKSHQADSRSRT